MSGCSWIALYVLAASAVACVCSHTVTCPPECQGRLVALNESWPSSRNTDCKMSEFRPCLLSLCAENGSMTRRRLWAVEKKKKKTCDWLPLKSSDT